MRVANHICHVFPSTSTQTWKNMKKHHPWVVSIHLPFASKIRWPRRPLFSTCANVLEGLDPPSKLPFWAASLQGWEDLVDSNQHRYGVQKQHMLSMSWKHRQTPTPPKHRNRWPTWTCDFTNLCFPSGMLRLPRPSTEKGPSRSLQVVR